MIRHTPEQIITKLRQAETDLGQGLSLAQVCQKLGVSENTFHRWRNQYGGIKSDEAKKLKELEAENVRSSVWSPSYLSTSRCSRRSPKKSGDCQAAPSGRAPPPGDLQGLSAPRLPCHGSSASDPEADAEKSHGKGAKNGGPHAGVGWQASTLRLPQNLGVAASGRLACQPQARLSSVAAARLESAQKTAEKASFGLQ